MEEYLILFVIISLAWTIFVIYFIFKILQFVIQAINLYKKILDRQDSMLKVMLDIRDNTKKYEEVSLNSNDGGKIELKCSHCGNNIFVNDSELKAHRYTCPACNTIIMF